MKLRSLILTLAVLSIHASDIVEKSANGNLEAVQEAIASGRDPVDTVARFSISADAKGESTKGTALHAATLRRHPEVVKALLAAHADPGLATSFKNTALHCACWAAADQAEEDRPKQLEIIRMLLDAGADINALNGGKSTPLALATASGDADIVRVLLEHGADANLADAEGKAPLHDASDQGFLEVVRELLAHGADANGSHAGVYKHWTPLMSAASEGHAEIARALLDGGADYGAKDSDGLDARAWAKKHGKEQVVLELAGYRVRMKRKQAAEKEL